MFSHGTVLVPYGGLSTVSEKSKTKELIPLDYRVREKAGRAYSYYSLFFTDPHVEPILGSLFDGFARMNRSRVGLTVR